MTEFQEYAIYPAEKPGLGGEWDKYPEWKEEVKKTLDHLKKMEKEGVWLKPKTEQELKASQSATEKIVKKFRESLAPFMDEGSPNSCQEALRIVRQQAGPWVSTFIWVEVAGPAFSKTKKLVKEIAGKNGLDEAAAAEIALEAADITAWSTAWSTLKLQIIPDVEFKNTLTSHNPFVHLLSLYELGAARIGFQPTEQGEKLAIDFVVQKEGKNSLQRLLL